MQCRRHFFLLIFFFSHQLVSWESHYLLTYQALRGVVGINDEATVPVETLDEFVQAEKRGLVNLLHQAELLSARSLMHYPALPEQLRFLGEPEKDFTLRKQFLMALRLNPDLSYQPFVLREPRQEQLSDENFSAQEIKEAPFSTLAKLDSGRALKKVKPGQKLSALAILATATEEPDHGMDFYLWKDSNSWYGALYNFDKQPFGNPLLSFGSQAPFHMGFYHESSLLYAAGPFLKRCYPELRINQFIALSRYAFATGHHYWGYRFLGLAIHYLQDLTQVYHSRVAPDQSVVKLIGINALSMLGLDRFKRETTQVLSNKHLGLESYQLGNIKAALYHPLQNSPLLKVLKDQSTDKNYGGYSHDYARTVIAKEAYERANNVDALVLEVLPARLKDVNFNFDADEPGVDLFLEINKVPHPKRPSFDDAFLTLMRSFGAHTRQAIRYVQAYSN